MLKKNAEARIRTNEDIIGSLYKSQRISLNDYISP
jgi:hypothetical protein